MSAFDPKRTSEQQRAIRDVFFFRGGYVRRRDFIKTIAGSAASWSFTARAQQQAMPVIGFLSGSGSPVDRARYLTSFRQGLREPGYIEGQNVMIEYRWAQDQYDRLPALAADLVRRQLTVIAAHDTSSSIDFIGAG